MRIQHHGPKKSGADMHLAGEVDTGALQGSNSKSLVGRQAVANRMGA